MSYLAPPPFGPADFDPPTLRTAFYDAAYTFDRIREKWIQGDAKGVDLIIKGASEIGDGYRWMMRNQARYEVETLLHTLQSDLIPFILPRCDLSLRDDIQRLMSSLNLDAITRDSDGEETHRYLQTWPATRLDADVDAILPKLRARGDAIALNAAALAESRGGSGGGPRQDSAMNADDSRPPPFPRSFREPSQHVLEYLNTLADALKLPADERHAAMCAGNCPTAEFIDVARRLGKEPVYLPLVDRLDRALNDLWMFVLRAPQVHPETVGVPANVVKMYRMPEAPFTAVLDALRIFDELSKADSVQHVRDVSAFFEREMPTDRVQPAGEDARTPSHSPDFTSVDWFGQRYTFAKGNQAQAVRVLWEVWESGGHSVTHETIGARIDSRASRFELAKVFRRKAVGGGYEPHPAWRTMIQPDSKGSYRLTPPESARIRK